MISGVDTSGFSRSMMGLWSEKSRPDPSEMAQEMFVSADVDGNGAVDMEEFGTALESKPGSGQGPGAEELFDRFDADGDGLLSEQEHADGLAFMHKDLARASMMTGMALSPAALAESLFERTDADGDGNITEEELVDAVSASASQGGGAIDASELMSVLDADGDGLITADEHAASFESMGGGRPMSGGHMPPSQEVFDLADTNQDGVVDAMELAASVTQANEASGGDVDAEALLASLDTDGDGVISQGEFFRDDGTRGTRGGEGQGPAHSLSSSGFAMYRMIDADFWSSSESGLLSLMT